MFTKGNCQSPKGPVSIGIVGPTRSGGGSMVKTAVTILLSTETLLASVTWQKSVIVCAVELVTFINDAVCPTIGVESLYH